MWQNELEAMIAAGGAPCRACGQRMLKADGCTWTHVKCGSRYYRRIKYGEDGMAYDDARCHDCGAKPGHYHHVGCDAERCPYAVGSSSAATATFPSMWSGRPEREQPSKSGSQNRPERPTGTFRAVCFTREPEVRKRRNREPIVSQNRSWRLPVGRTCRTCWRLSATP